MIKGKKKASEELKAKKLNMIIKFIEEFKKLNSKKVPMEKC